MENYCDYLADPVVIGLLREKVHSLFWRKLPILGNSHCDLSETWSAQSRVY